MAVDDDDDEDDDVDEYNGPQPSGLWATSQEDKTSYRTKPV
jgi:hypothetical protein